MIFNNFLQAANIPWISSTFVWIEFVFSSWCQKVAFLGTWNLFQRNFCFEKNGDGRRNVNFFVQSQGPQMPLSDPMKKQIQYGHKMMWLNWVVVILNQYQLILTQVPSTHGKYVEDFLRINELIYHKLLQDLACVSTFYNVWMAALLYSDIYFLKWLNSKMFQSKVCNFSLKSSIESIKKQFILYIFNFLKMSE